MPYPLISEELKQRFLSYLKRDGDCLIFSGGLVKGGYGWFNTPVGLPNLAHRFAFLLHNDILESKLLICHSCDTPACCNPNHLFQGTYQDNSDAKLRKNRDFKPIGEKNPKCVLSDAQVLEIRKLKLETSKTYVEISCLYGVTPETISHICRRITRNDI